MDAAACNFIHIKYSDKFKFKITSNIDLLSMFFLVFSQQF